MEQQIQGRDRQSPEQQTRETVRTPQPERERLSGAGILARALQAGAPLLEMPPQRLEELAALIGNQEMEALLEQRALPLEQVSFTLPPEVQTEPFSVPEGETVPTAEPPALTAGPAGGRAFDPAGLSFGGGGAYG